MNFDRRAFLRASSYAVFGLAIMPGLPLAAAIGGQAKARVRVVPLTAADQGVLEWIAAYSTKVRMLGGGVLSKLKGGSTETRFLVEISDLSQLQAALGAVLPFSEIRTSGNSLRFIYEGERFAIENLLPELFADRLKSLATRKRITFAHDALSYDPATQKLQDPYRSLASDAIKVINPGKGIAAAFRTVLRGWTEADELDLKLGANFARLKRRVLSVPGKRLGLAQPVVAALVEQLTSLTGNRSSEKIENLLRSKLVSLAISKVLGVSTNEVVAQFLAIKAEMPADSGDAAAWLASLLSDQLNNSTLPDWLGDLDPLSAYRARVALADARAVAARRMVSF